ncbi:hypothetical protein [Streptomyces sp. JJ38]|uniref:hypothetical protein n=1 Tax=Streptomyces sp. JJ38 TaxID=2738128 RepID=UPI001C5A1752|nr:hypothetical protein [Streptomyces sp. JJ38]MBW1596255.1 hypothetical protein [Streptomyces sp. JJ38]
MTDPEFETEGVPVRRLLRTLTRAGRVVVHSGRLALLTSYGREFDSAPVTRARLQRPWAPLRRAGSRRTVLVLGGTRYVLDLSSGERERLSAALGDARERAAKIASDRRIVHP